MVEKGVPLPVVELMCGRTIGVTQSYLKPEESKIKEYYADTMQRTVLSETQINATGRIQTLEEENKELKEKLSELESGKVKRKQEEAIAKLQQRLAKLEAIYSEKLKIKESQGLIS
jgi:regulator of replication initiation timing